jgi:hypothetical protein
MAEHFDSELNEQDIELIGEINKVKKRIMSLFKPEVIIDTIKANINGSDVLGFTNKRSEKFINASKPTFNILMSKEKCKEKYPSRTMTSVDMEVEWLSEIIYKEVITPFSTFIHKSAKDPAIQNTWNELFNENPIAADLDFLIFSSVFAMRIDLEKYSVNLEYLA